MKLFKRKKYLDKIFSAINREKIIILYWARQVWKTTLLKILLDDKNLDFEKKYLNFDDIYEKKFKSKDEFLKFLEFNYWVNFYQKWILFLDEIQTIENIEQILKSIYDDDKIKIKIIATWSWMFNVQKIWSSLVGRVKEIFIHPFSFFEFLEIKWVNIDFLNFSDYEEFMYEKIKIYFEEYYLFWGYPAVVFQKTKQEKIEKISEIINFYLKKDVEFFLSWKEIINFKKLFAYLANNISSALNISDLSKFLWVSRDKTEKYLEILEKSFLLYKVYPFFSNARKEYSKQSEYFLNDLWVINFFKNNFNLINFDWNLIENFVFLELEKNKKLNSDEIKTYNKINWSEIDFIYQFRERWIIPIEVKINNKTNIPKIFYWFWENYWDQIKTFIKTSESIKFQKDNVKIMPFG